MRSELTKSSLPQENAQTIDCVNLGGVGVGV